MFGASIKPANPSILCTAALLAGMMPAASRPEQTARPSREIPAPAQAPWPKTRVQQGPYSNQAAMNRISNRNARPRRDDYPLVDPSTGRTYHGNSYNYEYVRGGWVNPNDSTQLLQITLPGK